MHNAKQLDSTYMMLAFYSKEKVKELISAALHPCDKTESPHIVHKKNNQNIMI